MGWASVDRKLGNNNQNTRQQFKNGFFLFILEFALSFYISGVQNNTTANFIVIPEGLNRESSDFQCILDSGSSPE